MRQPGPPRRNGQIILGLLALLAASAACDDPLSPADVPGTYVLRLVRGERLPTALWAVDDVRVEVLADTLRLGANGRGQLVRITRLTRSTGASATPPLREERPLTYLFDGRELTGTYGCPPDKYCTGMVETFTAVLTVGGLRVVRALNERVPLEYEGLDR